MELSGSGSSWGSSEWSSKLARSYLESSGGVQTASAATGCPRRDLRVTFRVFESCRLPDVRPCPVPASRSFQTYGDTPHGETRDPVLRGLKLQATRRRSGGRNRTTIQHSADPGQRPRRRLRGHPRRRAAVLQESDRALSRSRRSRRRVGAPRRVTPSEPSRTLSAAEGRA